MKINGLLSCNKTSIPNKLNKKEATMLYVTKIRMHKDRRCSKYPEDIEQLYISEVGWCWKEVVHDYLLVNPKSIVVNIYPFPYLIPAVSFAREKYVRSNPNIYKHDNLLDLARA